MFLFPLQSCPTGLAVEGLTRVGRLLQDAGCWTSLDAHVRGSHVHAGSLRLLPRTTLFPQPMSLAEPYKLVLSRLAPCWHAPHTRLTSRKAKLRTIRSHAIFLATASGNSAQIESKTVELDSGNYNMHGIECKSMAMVAVSAAICDSNTTGGGISWE